MLSSFGYGTYIWLVKRDGSYKQKQLQLVLQLAAIAFVIGIFIVILFLSNIGKMDIDSIGFNAIYIVHGLLLLSVCIMTSYLVTERNKEMDILRPRKLQNMKYLTFNIEDSVLKEYALMMEKKIEDNKLYLHSNLSLDDLSAEAGIPKHHLSQVFNVYFGRTFYQYIGDRRIREAISRIEEDDNITLESLAHECGFNSKTSFNRYFKETTGMTPSEYRIKCETF